MATLSSGVPITVNEGYYAYNAVMSTGTATFQISLSDEAFADMKDGAFTETDNGILKLPNCSLQVVTTGDAVVTWTPYKIPR